MATQPNQVFFFFFAPQYCDIKNVVKLFTNSKISRIYTKNIFFQKFPKSFEKKPGILFF
jgi:hypothetical protein